MRLQARRYNKYGVAPKEARTVDGIVFASKREAIRYKDLKLMEMAGAISELKSQPRFPLDVAGVLICTYVADFQYVEDGFVVVEDVKGARTREYIIKSALFQALYPELIFRELPERRQKKGRGRKKKSN